MVRAGAVFCLVAVCLSTVAVGQTEYGVPLIVSTGEATVMAVPDFVDFVILRSFPTEKPRSSLTPTEEGGASAHTAAVAEAEAFESKLRDALNEEGLFPAEFFVSPIALPDVRLGRATIAATLRYTATPFQAPETGLKTFAAICDAVRKVAGNLECEVKGPYLDVVDRVTIEQMAVARATEQAYAPAEAAAAVLKAEIVSVEKVVIGPLQWNKEPGDQSAPAIPSPAGVYCTASVDVSYAYVPAQ